MSPLDAALQYLSKGFSILPISPKSKTPAIGRWKQLQESALSERDVRTIYEADPDLGVAIILGPVSGNLACRDYDKMESYDAWKQGHLELAASIPTVKTGRGMHVYLLLKPDIADGLRSRFGNPNGRGAIELSDGEFRMGSSYVVAPPSMHALGVPYTWVNGLDALQEIDPMEVGLVDALPGQNTQNAEKESEYQRDQSVQSNQSFQKTCSLVSLVPVGYPGISDAIGRCVVFALNTRHDRIFTLARELKAIPELTEMPGTAFRLVIEEWWKRSSSFIQNATSFDENWMDFLEGWDNVKYPKGTEPTMQIIEQAISMPPPSEAAQFDDTILQQLVTICSELQKQSGTAPFYISSRLAASVLYPGSDIEKTRCLISLRLRYLERSRLLKKTSQGNASNGKANRYLYLGTLRS